MNHLVKAIISFCCSSWLIFTLIVGIQTYSFVIPFIISGILTTIVQLLLFITRKNNYQ